MFRSRLILGLSALFRSRLILGLVSLGLFSTVWSRPIRSAEQVAIAYGPLEQSISIDTLKDYTHTGRARGSLALYAHYIAPQEVAQLRQVLQARIPLNTQQVSQFLATPTGEQVLQDLASLIQQDAAQADRADIRVALVNAASDPEGLTLLSILQHFPAHEIEINLAQASRLVAALNTLSHQTAQAIAAIHQQARQEALMSPFPPIASVTELLQPGEFKWQAYALTLTDQSRDRTFPVDLYLPNARTPHPIIVISHGFAANRASLAYLGQHLASYGFAVVIPEHPGSNEAYLHTALQGKASEVIPAAEFIDRPLDISYTLDQLDRLSQSDPNLKGRLDLNQVGIVGQSFGGYTALVLAGATLQFDQLEGDCQGLRKFLNASLWLQCRALSLPRFRYNLADPRVKAIIAINPVGRSLLGQASFSKLKVPTLFIAGSADTLAPVLLEQIQPFTWLSYPHKYFVLMNGGSHFSSIFQKPEAFGFDATANTAIARQHVATLSTAFLKIYVANQPSYRPYLSAAYTDAISHTDFSLDLVRSLTTTQLVQATQLRTTDSSSNALFMLISTSIGALGYAYFLIRRQANNKHL